MRTLLTLILVLVLSTFAFAQDYWSFELGGRYVKADGAPHDWETVVALGRTFGNLKISVPFGVNTDTKAEDSGTVAVLADYDLSLNLPLGFKPGLAVNYATTLFLDNNHTYYGFGLPLTRKLHGTASYVLSPLLQIVGGDLVVHVNFNLTYGF